MGWIFFINVPIGVAVVLMTLQTLRNRKQTEQRRIDGVGLALLIIGIGLVLDDKLLTIVAS